MPLAAAALLSTFPACKSTVVVGRSASVPAAVSKPAPPPPAEKKPEEEKPEEKKPEEKKPEEPAPAAAEETVEEKAQVTPQSSPARPRVEPEADRPDQKKPSPYQLDLAFGGFGLGIGYFDTPVAIAVDGDTEDMYIVDQGNYRVQKFDRFGIFQFAFGRQGMGDGEYIEQDVGGTPTLRMTGEFEFNKPVGILLDTDESRNLLRITVVDSLNYRIQRFLLVRNQGDPFPDDVFVMLPKQGQTTHDPDLKALYDSEGRQVILAPLYLSDQKADPFMLTPFVWGGLGFTAGLLNIPTYLTRDADGILYVSDTENGRVQGFNVTSLNPATDATFFREWGNDIQLPYGDGRLNQPTALAFDNYGFGGFLVIDKLTDGSYNIQKFDRQGQYLGIFSQSGSKEGQFRQPVAIAVNSFDNTVFVTDRGRRKIMVYSNNGEFLFEFGGEELSDPRGIAVLRNNFVYVTDAAKNMVYRYVPK